MISPSNSLWKNSDQVKKDSIVELWQNALDPLHSEFYHPYYSAFSYQIKDPLLFSQERQTIFLKDGTLTLLPLISRILNNKEKISCSFALPLHMAPLIPTEVKDYFQFYKYGHSAIGTHPNKENGLGFASYFAQHSSQQSLREQFIAISKLKTLTLIRPTLNEQAFKYITSFEYDLSFISNLIAQAKEIWPQVEIKIITLNQFKNLNLAEFQLINTNHYNYFCSEDFMTYYYFFHVGNYAFAHTGNIEKHYSHQKSFPFIKNRSLEFFKYEGPCLLDPMALDRLKKTRYPERTECGPDDVHVQLKQLFPANLRLISLDQSNKLHQFLFHTKTNGGINL